MRFLIVLALLLFPTAAQAQAPQNQETQPDKYVKIRLLPERGQVQGGDEIWVGIEQSIYPEWHTYWFNPGDSGTAPIIKWQLPDGFEIGGINWPVPGKIPYGPLANYGYANHVLLLQKLKIPDNIPDGPLRLTADVDVLVCNEICIPESGAYTLTLNDPANAGEDNRAYIETAVNKLPLTADWPALYHEEGGDFVLTITPPQAGLLSGSKGLAFYPTAWGLIANAEDPTFEIADTGLTIRQKRGERALGEVENFEALVTFQNPEGKTETFTFIAMPGSGAGVPAPATHAAAKNLSLAAALLFALLGGVILNLMPCVFPVLSLKALSLVKHSGESRALRLAGLSYTAGVIISFLGIAAILISFKAAGQSLGWGFQLQNPNIVALLAYLLFIIGLNLAGLFEISGRFGNIGNKLTQDTGAAGSFFTGVLATIVATPCTAPFMAAALGYALVQPAPAAVLIFAALGFGLAMPLLLLSFIPPLQKILPRPGAWMETFKQLLAFPVFASAAWLVWVLSQQAGSMGVLGVLMGMVAIAFGLWLLQHRPQKKLWKIVTLVLAIFSFVFALGFLPTPEIENDLARSEKLSFGEPYSQETLANLLLTDDPIFVEMTAAWCITCKLNHAVAIDTADTRAAFAQKKVHYLIGDWTNYDQGITDYLNSFGRNGVPLYVYYGPRDIVTGERPEALVLPQLLTPGSIVETIQRF